MSHEVVRSHYPDDADYPWLVVDEDGWVVQRWQDRADANAHAGQLNAPNPTGGDE